MSTLLFFATKLDFEEDISKLIPQSEETKTLNKVLNNTNFSDKIIVNISTRKNGTTENLIAYAEEIIDSLQLHCKDYILNIQGEISNDDMVNTMDFVYNNLPLFMEEKDYQYLRDRFSEDSLTAVITNNFKILISPSGIFAKNTIRKDPFGLSFRALKKLEDLKLTDNFEIYNGFLITKDKKNLLLFIKPKLPTNETDANTDFVNKLYAISDGLNQKYVDIVVSEYYGSTVIAVANASQIKTDIKYTITLALLVLIFILIFFYRKLFIPILLFIPTIFGALTAMVTLLIIRENISAISLGIGSVLLGITLDYSLHILTHYRNNNDVNQLYKDITKPILMSSITTAVAFLCLLLLRSQALQDLGIFAAISVLSTSIYALLIIPLFYKPKILKNKFSKNFIEVIANYSFDKNKFIYTGIFIVLILSFFTFKNVRFNKDLNSMNYQSEVILNAEKNLDSMLSLSSKSVYLVGYGNNLNEVLQANTNINQLLQRLELTNDILQFSSNGSVVLSENDQQKKLEIWNSFWTDSLKHKLKIDLIEKGEQVGFNASTYKPFYNLIYKDFNTIDLEVYNSVKSLLAEEYIVKNSDFITAVSLVKINGSQKEHLSQLVDEIPNALLIDRKQISETFLGGLKDDFSSLINYSLIAIVIILLLFFRNIELTLLTVFPIVLTWMLTLGVMGFFGIEFTIFNVIITTFIFGLGVDYSIFMTNALVKDYTYGTKEIATYKISILLSVITTILGVGVLIFAKHPALKSISILSLIGILITVLVTFTIQPLLFRIFIVNRAKNGFSPIKIRSFLYAIFTLLIYGLGGMFLSILSITILPLIPIAKKNKFKWLHKAMAKFVQIVLYTNPFVKKRVINSGKEDFKKPAIIIANHSSSLDTLTMGLLTPNLIYLVNDWVYKSPIFGILAKVAGFYPVSKGAEEITEPLKEKIRQGYSLMVFPEAKRSFTNKVGRFHKGAFFLQEQLKLDIVPVYLHGNAEVMPKNDFIIHDGSLTVKVGDRIAFDDKSFGLTSRERNKKISKYFKSNFLEFRDEIENKNYYRGILLSNYLYKDKKIQNLVKEDFEKYKSLYYNLNITLPRSIKILHIGNDFGQIDILLVSKSIERKIDSFISDENHLNVAKNCYTVKCRKVTYIENLSEIKAIDYELLLISDAIGLKYLDQKELLAFKQVFVLNKTLSEVKTIKNEDKNISRLNELIGYD
ncbi:MAG: 1-acyl-sn-glycerol-3-phosphate acyltransferase [Flavobacteriaceae bacterium]|nr:1-acyl-sn-glycerol-3-phosphate acyltransferase [Flavobacteriaceae bacterium]